MIFITKGGLQQQVSEAAFEQLFQPSGWVIDTERKEVKDEVQETVKTFAHQGDAKNYLRMTRVEKKTFDDNIFKSGG